jgi:hypothetical protein
MKVGLGTFKNSSVYGRLAKVISLVPPHRMAAQRVNLANTQQK